MVNRVFRPPLWAWFVVVLAVAATASLGLWQWHRGEQKAGLLAQLAAVRAQAPQAFSPALPDAGTVRKVELKGRYRPQQQIFLDNQPRDGRPGVDVWTLFEVQEPMAALIVVDRGWLPLAQGRLPVAAMASDAAQPIEGYWRRLPRPALRLDGGTGQNCALVPAAATYPTAEQLRCWWGGEVVEGLLELDPAAPDGFLRQWTVADAVEIPPARHYAYAAQWWAFSLTAMALFVLLNLKKKSLP